MMSLPSSSSSPPPSAPPTTRRPVWLMAELEPPLARVPFLAPQVSPGSARPAVTINAPSPTGSPRMSSMPATPDTERSRDPLSAHILARRQTTNELKQETPSFRRGLSDLVSGKDKVSPEQAPAAHPWEVEKKERKKRVSFFAKLRGKDHHQDTSVDSPEDMARAEGAQACAFSRSEAHKTEQPNYIRIRSHNKPKRDFDNVFLAQELRIASVDETGDSSSGEARSSAIWSMKFSADGRYLATGGQDMVVRVWKVLATPADRRRSKSAGDGGGSTLTAPVFCTEPYREYEGHTADVLDLSWSKNNFLLSSSMDKTVRLWHVTQEECLCCFQHSDFVTSIAFHPKDDRYFLSGSLDCRLRLWNIPKKHVEYWNELPELITAVAFDPVGRVAIAGSLTGLCLFYETEGLRYHTQIHVRSTRGRNSHGSKITGIQAISIQPGNSNSETKLLITSNDSRIRLYNMRDKSLEAKFKGNDNASSQIRATFSDDHKYVICGSEDRQVYIWDTECEADLNKSKGMYEHFEAHTNIVCATVFAPNATRELLAASGDPIYDIVMRDSQNRRLNRIDTHSTSEGYHDRPHLTASDGNIIVSAGQSGCIKVFRQDSANPIRHRMDERSDTNSVHKSSMRRASLRSSGTGASGNNRPASVLSEEKSSIVMKPHEAIIPVSPARAQLRSRHAGVETASDTESPPRMRVNGKSADFSAEGSRSNIFKTSLLSENPDHRSPNPSDESMSNHAAPNTNGVPKSQKLPQQLEINPYIAPGGASLGFYDIETRHRPDLLRPSNSRTQTGMSWTETYQESIVCSQCGHHAFGATKVGGEMRLKCENCSALVS